MRNEVTISDPVPARFDVGGEACSLGGTSRSASIRVLVDGGMMRGRLSGLAKKRNTRSTGNGTQSENRNRSIRSDCAGVCGLSTEIYEKQDS